jgi:SPP1 family phage portal protein
MDLETAKNIIKKHISGHGIFAERASVAERYYRVQNDIMFRVPKKDTDGTENPLRTADNRIPHSFYSLLVNQKVAYMFTAPPTFDVKNDVQNKAITDALGDAYAKRCKDLAVNASNAGIAWVHYWQDNDGFKWGVVPSDQVIPLWSSKLDHELLAVLRVYKDYTDDGRKWDIYEYWNSTECQMFRKQTSDDIDTGLMPWQCFTYYYEDGSADMTDTMTHDFGRPPFIPFRNNDLCTSDLDNVKGLIDAYDKTYSGFMDDLEDIQEVIFVLTNYGGEDLGQFIKEMKYFKAINMDNCGNGDASGVSTLTIDIPVEARDKMLDLTRKSIFDMGQGIDPQQQGLDATSGEAMKFLYALLELKSGMMETEFRLGFNELVRAILRNKGVQQTSSIIQTWTRTSIRNDSELVDMCSKSTGIISKKTIIKNHPFVQNAEDEENQINKEEEESNAKNDIYGDFGQQGQADGGKGGE